MVKSFLSSPRGCEFNFIWKQVDPLAMGGKGGKGKTSCEGLLKGKIGQI